MPLRILLVCLFQTARLFRTLDTSSIRSIACMHAHTLARTCVQSFVSCASQMPAAVAFKRHEYAQYAPQHAHTFMQLQPKHDTWWHCVLFMFCCLIRHCHPANILRPRDVQPAEGAQTGILPAILLNNTMHFNVASLLWLAVSQLHCSTCTACVLAGGR